MSVLTIKMSSLQSVFTAAILEVGAKNDFPLGNKFCFYANIFYCLALPAWSP